MLNGEKTRIVLVAAKEDLLNNLRDALGATDLALLHAQTKHQAVVLFERLKSEIDLAIIDLDSQHLAALDLIEQLTRHPRMPMKIIATTTRYSKAVLAKVIDLGVDAVVPEAVSPEKWRITIEAVLRKATTPEPKARIATA